MGTPSSASMLACRDVNLSLFEEDDPHEKMRLARLIDDLNHKHEYAVELAAMHGQSGQAPLRIPFGAPVGAPERLH